MGQMRGISTDSHESDSLFQSNTRNPFHFESTFWGGYPMSSNSFMMAQDDPLLDRANTAVANMLYEPRVVPYREHQICVVERHRTKTQSVSIERCRRTHSGTPSKKSTSPVSSEYLSSRETAASVIAGLSTSVSSP